MASIIGIIKFDPLEKLLYIATYVVYMYKSLGSSLYCKLCMYVYS